MDVAAVLRRAWDWAAIRSVADKSWSSFESELWTFARQCKLPDELAAGSIQDCRRKITAIENYRDHTINDNQQLPDYIRPMVLASLREKVLKVSEQIATSTKRSLLEQALSRTEKVFVSRSTVASTLGITESLAEALIQESDIAAEQPSLASYTPPTTPEEAEMQLSWLMQEAVSSPGFAHAVEVEAGALEQTSLCNDEQGDLLGLIQDVLMASPGHTPDDDNPLFNNL